MLGCVRDFEICTVLLLAHVHVLNVDVETFDCKV